VCVCISVCARLIGRSGGWRWKASNHVR